MTSEQPMFSIIIPAHNSEGFIRNALNSIVSQSVRDYQLIVVCDSCDDLTEAVARRYTPYVYSVNFHNDGLTRNYGLERATGTWVLFMDDDDLWMHGYVLRMLSDELNGLSYVPDIVAFGFIFRHIGYAPPVRKSGALWANVWHKMWRRDFIGDRLRFKNIPMESDLHFCRDALKLDPRIATLNHALYYYNYMRKGSQTELASREEDAVDG